jgi:hypothetical protein
MPAIPNAPLNATVLAIAERAANLISGQELSASTRFTCERTSLVLRSYAIRHRTASSSSSRKGEAGHG